MGKAQGNFMTMGEEEPTNDSDDMAINLADGD